MSRRRPTASPLATFLDYILTTTPAEAQAAIEASIAALGARMRVLTAQQMAKVPAAKLSATVAHAINAGATFAATAATAAATGPVGVPAPRPGKPGPKPGFKPKPKAPAAEPLPAAAPVALPSISIEVAAPTAPTAHPPMRRRSRPPVTTAVPLDTTLPPPGVPLPDQQLAEEE